MRLTPDEKNAFILAIDEFVLQNEQVELCLFGSRLHDGYNGGDFDILIITHSQAQRKQLSMNKANILGKLYLALDQENIDLLITHQENNTDAFIESALKQAVTFHRWPQSNENHLVQ